MADNDLYNKAGPGPLASCPVCLYRTPADEGGGATMREGLGFYECGVVVYRGITWYCQLTSRDTCTRWSACIPAPGHEPARHPNGLNNQNFGWETHTGLRVHASRLSLYLTLPDRKRNSTDGSTTLARGNTSTHTPTPSVTRSPVGWSAYWQHADTMQSERQTRQAGRHWVQTTIPSHLPVQYTRPSSWSRMSPIQTQLPSWSQVQDAVCVIPHTC